MQCMQEYYFNAKGMENIGYMFEPVGILVDMFYKIWGDKF